MMSRNSRSIIVILLQLQVTVLIVSGALIETNGQRKNGACYHNGTYYYEQSFVPSIEPCLSCRCLKSNLICSLKVCPELPVPPPRGCVVIKKPESCCPYLSCNRKDFHIPKKRLISYLDRFDKESIDRIINLNFHQRRSDDAEDLNDEICIKNGTVYKSGSAMMSSGLCTYCYCIGGQQKCVKPKCILPIYEFGCKPIFVDSTCCPVRYDCNTKSIGKSNLPGDRYRKTTNKHYERMSQRLERNRGCTVDDRYYSEGQKMPRESNKPCDICFCIRGRRKCTPKKCSPPLRNCIPIVPKGQCCPSSYECGNPKELSRFQRSHQSRQFDLFSLIFGDEQGNNQISQNNMQPPTKITERITKTNQEKGFLDSIRDGLQFIDKNGENVEHILDKSVPTSTTPSTKLEISSTGENIIEETAQASDDDFKENEDEGIGFLDILLSTKTPRPELSTSTEAGVINDSEEEDDEDISWFDLLLGKDNNGTSVNNVTKDMSTKKDNIILQSTAIPLTTEKYVLTTSNPNEFLDNITTTTSTLPSIQSQSSTPTTTTSLKKFSTENVKKSSTKTTSRPNPTTQIKQMNSTEMKASEKNIYEIIDKRTRPVQLERVATTTSSSTRLPVVVKTNPTILESDFMLDYVDPTLPPSLPNLDIIQFMPGDAVKTTRYPAITEKNVVLDPKLPNYQDYTADYEDYPPEPSQHTGFSPPTETEGGFIPKDPASEKTIKEKPQEEIVTIIEADDKTQDPVKNNTKLSQLLAPFNKLPPNYLMKPNGNLDQLEKESNKLTIPPFLKLPLTDVRPQQPLFSSFEKVAEVQTKPPQTTPSSTLKLSGCNIYGRMYRVGRIISELSGPCLECRCTESGVDCKPLDCLDVKKID